MAASLRRLGHRLGDHKLVVCVGGDEEQRDLYQDFPWSRNYPLTWLWVDRERFRKDSFWETSHELFRQRASAHFVMYADADVIFVCDFSELLEDLERSPAIAGVIAHAPPFSRDLGEEMWEKLFNDYGVTVASSKYEHTGWGFMVKAPQHRYTPPYFNFGMVLAPAEMAERIGAELVTADNFVTRHLTTFFRFQIALTLIIAKNQLPTRALPLRYNFPNDPRFDQKYPDDLGDLRILHYLRREIVDRERDFMDLAHVFALIQRRDLQGSNEILRRRLEELYPTIREEEGSH